MLGGLARALGDANVLDHVLNLLGRRRSQVAHDEGDGEVNQHSDKADSLRRNSKPVFLAVRKELKINDLAQSEPDPGNHSRYRALFVYSF